MELFVYYIQLEECYSCPITSSPTLSEEPAINFKYIVLIHNGFRPIKPILLFISYTDDSGTTKRLITNLNDLPISASDCYYHKLNITPILSSLLCQDIMNNDGKKYLEKGEIIMNNKNTGIEYEKLIQTIFSQMQEQDLVKTINIQQNIIIQGKTIKHQVDVYWEFEIGGITYKTIVQAKDWNSKVKQEQLLSFAQVLEDIPGQPRGIFVTKTGYQKGAKEFAKQNNICLYELFPI